MALHLRNTLVVLTLLAGIVWSLPMEMGLTDTDPAPAAYSAADPAEFTITSYRHALLISGHSRSNRHEQRIVDAAETNFPSHSTHIELHPLGVAPAWWEDATVALIASLALMESATAYVTEDTLRIRALVTDKPAAEHQLETLHQALPPSTDIDARLTAIDAGTGAEAYCAQQFGAYTSGPVAFEESGTEMRLSAYPVLDGVVALADACRAATITITGHTDSSGNEARNRQLSLARARTVATYLNSRGIAEERLVVVGAGSSVPVADNATRYGRSINRRIDIRFTSTSD